MTKPESYRITLGCPACKEEFFLYERYDEDIDSLVKCKTCGHVGPKWTFLFVKGTGSRQYTPKGEIDND